MAKPQLSNQIRTLRFLASEMTQADLAERVGGHRMCQWEVREPGDEAAQVPLPRPRPASAAP